MFKSLRTRLWLTYALLAGVVLFLVFLGLLVYFIRNPALDRQLSLRLEVLATDLLNRSSATALEPTPIQINAALDRASQAYQVRLLLLDAQGSVVYDTGLPGQAAGKINILPRQLRTRQGLVGDQNRQLWVYGLRPFNDGGYLIALEPRPARGEYLRRVFGNDSILRPFFEAGITALLLSLLLGIGIARWVAGPLRRISAAAHGVAEQAQAGLPAGRMVYPKVPVEGPQEVQDLAHSFNQMSGRLENSQRAQRDFVANVSHELKTPLTSIQGFAQALLDETADTPAARQQAASVIFTEANRMERLVNGLLELARFDAGSVQLETHPVIICELLEHIVQKFIPQAKQAAVELQLDCQELPGLEADGDRLVQVFSNIIDNAIQHTPPGGLVRVVASQEEDWLVISVSDTGSGISPQDLPRIFERFYQVDQSRQGGEAHGSGLGLAIAREIVQAHGGQITAESQLAHGSRFVVKLPVARPVDRNTSHSVVPPSAPQPKL
jgi:two-component system OmpR family sensor kinase